MKFSRCRTQLRWGSHFGSPTWIMTLFVMCLLRPFGLQCTWWVLIQINHFLYQAVCDSTSPGAWERRDLFTQRVIELVLDPQAERCSLFSCWDCLRPLIWLTLLRPLFDPSSKLFGSLQSMSTHRITSDLHSCSGLRRCRTCSVFGLQFHFSSSLFATNFNFTRLHQTSPPLWPLRKACCLDYAATQPT